MELDLIEAEGYCVDSGFPVRWMSGDRCAAHGAEDAPCFAARRDPRCQHPRWPDGANGSERCPECGVVIPDDAQSTTRPRGR